MESLYTSEERREKAAAVIQRNYRGHRARRMLNGLSLDPSSRWIEAIKEARYRHIIEPKARPVLEGGTDNGTLEHQRSSSFAKQNWKKVGLITRRAGGDEDPESESEEDEHMPPEEREAYQKRQLEEKLRRHKAAKMMDLQYFLEMVDLKHRYGANLRTYHEQWKKSNTNENFFYWLDYGEGKYIDCLGCPREKLDREQIRYLSREERLNYLVMVDQEGRLCWVKNGARIDTTEKYKDSIHGIVPENDSTPAYTPLVITDTPLQDTSEGTYSSSLGSEGEEDHTPKYITVDPDQNMKRVKHVSAATILDKLLRGTVKENTWIFVADTNFRLYVGMKQSGSFQHSSFLHGSRISAAGSITIKNGRITKLSPLSGHYRPPVANFRAFISSLKTAGVDMSHVSISRSYAILVGIEAYTKTRNRGRKLVKKFMHGRDKALSREQSTEKEEREKERRLGELRQRVEKEDRLETAREKMRDKLNIEKGG